MPYEPGPEEVEAIRADRARKQSLALPASRGLPVSEEAEQGVLCSILLSPEESCAFCAEKKVQAGFFYAPHRALIFEQLMEMWSKRRPIDFITLTQWLHDLGLLEESGGAAYVAQLFTYLPTAANLEYYLTILTEKWVDRQSIIVHTEMAAKGYAPGDTWERLQESEMRVLGIRASLSDAKVYDSRSVVVEAMNQIQDAYDRKGSIVGMATGFQDLDRKTLGFKKSEFIVIAGRPSHGKTALAMNIAEHQSVDLRNPIAVFSLEMSRQQLMQRMICSRAKVNLHRVLGGHSTERDFPAMAKAASQLADAPLYFDDQAGITIQEVRGRARRLKSQYDIRAIFVDYLQLLKSGSKRAQENRTQEVNEISQGLKEMARELDIPVIALAQIGRDFEKRAVVRPKLSDLRESGNIEQDADVVAFVVNESLMLETEEERMEARGRAELIIAKQRSGPIGAVPLTFIDECVRFETRATYDDPQGSFPV